ncbi:MAG: precorrin-6y C5,15-methyltransferase (decarboxylating) subunit CbiE, partial [Propionicimonas sp.]
VVGGTRHLDALGVPPQRRITLGALRPAVEAMAALDPEARVVVVASGDPLFFGVVRSLRSRGLNPEVVTAPSSISSAFAAVALPWDDAVVVSAHGRPLAPALHLARALPKVAVFTSPEHGIRELAAGLSGLERWFVLAERLGEPDARVRVLNLAEALTADPVEPNVVLVLAEHPGTTLRPWPGGIAGPRRPDRPSTNAVAAVAFVRLLPEPGELVWAFGALGEEVGLLAGWAQAAVLLDPAAGDPDPDVVATDRFSDLELLVGRSPRAVCLATTSPPPELPSGYHWQLERLSVNGTEHHLATGNRP